MKIILQFLENLNFTSISSMDFRENFLDTGMIGGTKWVNLITWHDKSRHPVDYGSLLG